MPIEIVEVPVGNIDPTLELQTEIILTDNGEIIDHNLVYHGCRQSLVGCSLIGLSDIKTKYKKIFLRRYSLSGFLAKTPFRYSCIKLTQTT